MFLEAVSRDSSSGRPAVCRTSAGDLNEVKNVPSALATNRRDFPGTVVRDETDDVTDLRQDIAGASLRGRHCGASAASFIFLATACAPLPKRTQTILQRRPAADQIIDTRESAMSDETHQLPKQTARRRRTRPGILPTGLKEMPPERDIGPTRSQRRESKVLQYR